MKKKIILILVLMLIPLTRVNAATCSKEKEAELKKLATQIKISYQYNEEYEKNNNYGSFKIIISGITDDMYAYDNSNKKMYFTKDKVIMYDTTYGEKNIEIISLKSDCYGKVIFSKMVNIPKFNPYSLKNECKDIDISKFKMCDKWYQFNIDEKDYYAKIKQYKSTGTIEEDIKNIEPEEIKKISNNNSWIYINKLTIIIVLLTLTIVAIIITIVGSRKRKAVI